MAKVLPLVLSILFLSHYSQTTIALALSFNPIKTSPFVVGRSRFPTHPEHTKLLATSTSQKDETCEEVDSTNDKNPKTDSDDPFLKYPKRVVSASVSTQLPFCSTVAFDAFSDLPRQPSWAPWLRSVTYIDEVNNDSSRAYASNKTESTVQSDLPLRETLWTLRLRRINFSWRAISTQLERPYLIQWESTSGIRNRGKVEFIDITEESCHMIITMSFVMPRVLVKIFQRSNVVQNIFSDQMLGGMLERFRYVVMTEDLGITEQEPINKLDD